MRDPPRFRHDVAHRGECRGRLCQRRSAALRIEKACGATSAASRTATRRGKTARAGRGAELRDRGADHESETSDELNPVIIAESTTVLKQLSVSEASWNST